MNAPRFDASDDILLVELDAVRGDDKGHRQFAETGVRDADDGA